MYEKDAWTEEMERNERNGVIKKWGQRNGVTKKWGHKEMGSDSIENIKTRENTGFNVSFKWDVFLKLKGYPYKFKKKKSASFHA